MSRPPKPGGRPFLSALFGSCLALLACQPSGGDPSSSNSGTDESASLRSSPIELFTWWARVGESDTFGELMRVHAKRFPGDVLINATAELSGTARKTLKTRMDHNDPPETFQANIGTDLMNWVLVNGLDARESKLLPLDGVVPDTETWRKAFPKQFIDLLSYDGKMYAVPSNAHRLNCLYYNKRIFQKYNIPIPTSPSDIKSIAQQLAGKDVIPLAIGSRDPWTLSLYFFENLMVALEGRAFYTDYFSGLLRSDDPRVERALDMGLQSLEFANPDHAQLTWLQAIDLVIQGRAAMTVMGDWAKITFEAHGFKMGVDYEEIAFPGSEDTFVFTSDTFPLPIHAKNREGAIRLLSTMGSKEGQEAMNRAKGALSARIDVPVPNDPLMRRKHELLRNGSAILALSGRLPAQFAQDLNVALMEASTQKDVEPLLHMLKSRYALLK